MKFIDQKRVHQRADAAFVKRKFLDIRYAPEGDWMLPGFYSPDGEWKTARDRDDTESNYPGMKFAAAAAEAKTGTTAAERLEEEIAAIERVSSEKAVPTQGDVLDTSDGAFPCDGQHRLLDIYLPNEGDGPYPVVIDLFGGGFYFGRKSSHKLEPALNLLRRGFAVVSINYSMSFQAEFPVQIQEIKAAIRFIRKHAEEYGLDGSRIALMGESAGAHMAALAATSASCGELVDSRWPNQDVSDEVQAVIAVYCPVNLGLAASLFEVERKAYGLDTILKEGGSSSMEAVLLGGPVNERPWMNAMANPETYVNKNCPPFLFLHGTQDQVVPILGSMHFAATLIQKIGTEKVQYQIVEGAHHNIHDFEEEWIYNLEAKFLKEQMG